MELDFITGKLNVNYGDNLVTLLREVRQLLAMGFAVPVDIQQIAEIGQKFFRHGVVLKQVANFYNTIDLQMLSCQQSMLLQQALDFEQIVKNPKGTSGSNPITWDDPKELEVFIKRLQQSAEILTSENRKLKQFHLIILEQVSKLMNVDLIKNQPKWKESINSIRTTINLAYENGLKHESTLAWRNHWDYQLYKALEYQYKVGLENLHEMLPELKIDLIFKQQKLQFRPSFEEIRAKYYRSMKKIINTPSCFKGLGDTNIFCHMVDNNSQSLMTVYTIAENLFLKLSKVMDVFKDWVILGQVDLEEFVEDSLENVLDWEMNFRLLKEKGKDAEQLPLIIKIDCVNVNTTPVKAAIDDHLQRLFDALLSSLRKTILNHVRAIDQFIDIAMEILLKRPQTIAEIGYANSRHEELSKNKVSIQTHFELADSKNRLLKHVSGSGMTTFLNIQALIHHLPRPNGANSS
jgi:dynein heavy chain 2